VTRDRLPRGEETAENTNREVNGTEFDTILSQRLERNLVVLHINELEESDWHNPCRQTKVANVCRQL
jgi:hypothetical protein